MKVKGYIRSIDIDRDTNAFMGYTMRAEVIFTEGDQEGLLDKMRCGEPIEIDVPLRPEWDAKKVVVPLIRKFRMLRLRNDEK